MKMNAEEIKDEMELQKDIEENWKEIMKDIAAARKMAHMSQTELGKIVEKSTTTISRYENGTAIPNTETLKLMLGALATELQDLKMTTIIIKTHGREDIVYKAENILFIADDYSFIRGNNSYLELLYLALGSNLYEAIPKCGKPAVGSAPVRK